MTLQQYKNTNWPCNCCVGKDGLYHVIVETTNTVTGAIYIGSHSTINPNDRYPGSGRNLYRALAQYGKGAFSTRIILCAADEKQLRLFERGIVDDDFIRDPMTYNLIKGGGGRTYGTKNRMKVSDVQPVVTQSTQVVVTQDPSNSMIAGLVSIVMTGVKKALYHLGMAIYSLV